MPTRPSPALLSPVPFTQVRIADSFWAPRRRVNADVTIPHALDMLERTGTIHAFDLAASGEHRADPGPVFRDSDLYKAIEAGAFALAEAPNPALEARLDAIIAKIAAAQDSSGYLNTFFQVDASAKRWRNLRDEHELYCAGHLFEAAAAHFRATGKRTLLDVAIRLADHIGSIFGKGAGKREGYCGHPEIELALFKLGRATRLPQYNRLAKYFLDARGGGFFAREHGVPPGQYDGTLWLDNVPLRRHDAITGHAVRALYLQCAAADYAAATGDPKILAMMERVWQSAVRRRMFVTGGVGSCAKNEGFTEDYDLPLASAYQETCASIAMALWNHRLALLHGDARFADVMERALYNGFLAGVSLDGKRFFYVNPLENGGWHHRAEWHGCACCPPNVARTLAALGQFAYAVSDFSFYVNLYIQGAVNALIGLTSLTAQVKTNYPWDGRVHMKIEVDSPACFALRLRKPEWCSRFELHVGGKRIARPALKRGYIVIEREWESGDEVECHFEMPIQILSADPHIRECQGRVALRRGPLVYCFEACDQKAPLETISLPADFAPRAVKSSMLGHPFVAIKGMARADANDWSGGLYQPALPGRRTPVTAIPYYLWDNREAGPMKVWAPKS